MYKIILKKEGRDRLKEKYKVCDATVSLVLSFKRMTELHCTMRSYAMNELKGWLIEN